MEAVEKLQVLLNINGNFRVCIIPEMERTEAAKMKQLTGAALVVRYTSLKDYSEALMAFTEATQNRPQW